MKQLDSVRYLLGDKYILDIDPSFIVQNETGTNYNWSAGTFSNTITDTENVTLANESDAFESVGNYTSQSFDAGAQANWTNLSWTGVVVNDTIDNNTKLLLHFDGDDGENTTKDFGATGHTITFIDDANITTKQKKIGNASLGCSGNGDPRITAPSSPDWSFGTGDYTLEFWIYQTTGKDNVYVFDRNQGAAPYWRFESDISGSDQLMHYTGDGFTAITSNTVYTLNAWHHFALVRSGGTHTLYQDGLSVGSAANTGNFVNTNVPIGICGYSAGGNTLPGYMDEVRISNGVARYSTNFTVASEEFGSIEQGNLTAQTRFSNDGITWTSWSNNHTNPSGVLNESARYAQVRFELFTDDTTLTPYLQDFTIEYESLNAAPSFTTSPTINSTDGTNKTDQDLNCFAELTDDDGETMTGNVTFNLEGVPQVNFTDETFADSELITYTLDSGNTSAFQNWTCEWVVTDLVDTTGENSSTLYIIDNPPTFFNKSLLPTTAYQNNSLNFSIGVSDEENNTEMVWNVTWEVNGATNYSNVSKYNNGSYKSFYLNPALTAKDEKWCANISVSDGVNSDSTDGECIVISDSPPEWTVVPSDQSVVAGNETNYTLQCSDPDGSDVNYTNNYTGTSLSYYSLFNNDSGLFQFRPSYFEFSDIEKNGKHQINVTCSNGAEEISAIFGLNVTAATGGGTVTTDDCKLTSLKISDGCAAYSTDPNSTLIRPS